MRFTVRAASLGLTTVAAVAAYTVPAFAVTAAQGHRPSSAPVFVQTDNTGGNTVVAYDRAADGTLHQAGSYSTGGLGGDLPGTGPDHLASQGALSYDAHAKLLYAVNAGSDTVTVFSVHGDRLVREQIISSGGSFPVSVTAQGDKVYVANTLAGGSIQGYLRVGHRLVEVPSWNRALAISPAPAASANTVGQVGLTPDGSRVVVTTKGAGNSIEVFPLGRYGTPSALPVVNTVPGTAPFGLAFDAAGRLAVAQARTNSVATYRVGHDGTLTAVAQAPTGQTATCWILATSHRLYAANAASASVTGFQDSGHGLTAISSTGTDPGAVDAAASSDGRTLYDQTGINGIVDEFRVNPDGTLTPVGSVTVPGAVGGEGIVAL
ncbi:lactonase family protein [Streptacidiphilus sp. EB129]|uniref:lactonase family protein n=1 Tax=Streptacidiphilus sp. EB129 TaxID=3156262 RepID=UPI0035193B79